MAFDGSPIVGDVATGFRLHKRKPLLISDLLQGPARQGLPVTWPPGGHISTELRINDRIRVPEVRLVGPNGETVGIVPTDQALKLAQEADLDLVEIAPQGKPPVCKLMDYGKFKYENAQKAREARRNQTNVIIKEMKLRPKIDAHDYETKKGHVVRFLKRRRQGQDHDHVPRSRAAPPRAGLPAAPEAGRGRHGAGLRRVLAEAGRPQHDHGARPAQEEGRRQGRRQGREGRARPPSAPPLVADEQAERDAAHAAGPVAQKKERGRSENLDPEIEA